MSADSDIDALLGDVKLDGEEPEAAKTDAKDDKAKDEPKAKRSNASDEAKAERAAEMDEQLKVALKKHLPNPELSLFMVDLLSPGTAAVNLNLNLTPGQHALIAFGGVALAALATNPEVMAKLRTGFTRKGKKEQHKPQQKTKALDAKASPAAPPKVQPPQEPTA